ncbi:hypothetical protein A2856_04265 [Candidatus Uhrbacteria bacterium RIFCSPHIGHO2_01_FULL_63_20]|uniref:Type 4 fimbrial biogenesis protein PilX N-terminal domain-containing protein n=1 Tax=Candidatus Uhrbacteria bacterium RIFCSPHIGHO2_01_FULL_63_20 TaxID=1802385 RepID=A0A1F7TMP2_9BACT|nr:MAG: hypothetical protein A2856_04265 [Candidatus Uhrbacteria bacterium RIFCSPHIGHO2_01_FULL_63_20]
MNDRGFTLVVSVMIISAVLLGLAVAAARTLHGTLSSGTSIERWDDAKALAEGCAEQAIWRLTEDQNYAGNETIAINGSPCTIRPVTGNPTPKIVETEATVGNRTYRLRVTVSSLSPPTVSAWDRVTSF